MRRKRLDPDPIVVFLDRILRGGHVRQRDAKSVRTVLARHLEKTGRPFEAVEQRELCGLSYVKYVIRRRGHVGEWIGCSRFDNRREIIRYINRRLSPDGQVFKLNRVYAGGPFCHDFGPDAVVESTDYRCCTVVVANIPAAAVEVVAIELTPTAVATVPLTEYMGRNLIAPNWGWGLSVCNYG